MKNTTTNNSSRRKYNRHQQRNSRNSQKENNAIIIRNRDDKNQLIKDAIFAFSGGKKSLLIKGEGNEISTAVEVAEIIKNRMYPGIEVANISLGSRPYFQKNNSKSQKSDIVSKIEILLKST
ncbi:MAG: hypothetical protein ACFFAS_01760 [Promethearchaeota archaeon]